MSFTPHPINPDLDLELVREVPVTPQAVFEAWTDPASLKGWFAPRPYSIERCEIDLRPGGRPGASLGLRSGSCRREWG